MSHANLGRWAEAETDFAGPVERLDEKNALPWKFLLYARLPAATCRGIGRRSPTQRRPPPSMRRRWPFLCPTRMRIRLQPLYDQAQRAGGKRFGAICARLGRFEEALPPLQTSKPTESDEYLPLLALACHRLGQADKARATLDRAVACHARHVERREPDPATRDPLPVEKRVAFAALLREAQTTIGYPSHHELAPAPRPVAPMPRETK